MNSKLKHLHDSLNKEMKKLGQSPYLDQVLTPGFVDQRLYAIYMCETYHYTFHNAKNQALVACRKDKISPQYMKYCLSHALEEVGHELMAFHDLKKLGIEVKISELPAPLTSTQSLIAYLYYISEYGNPLARLGYSFWAERVYEHMSPLLSLMSDGLGIPKKAMTFFNEHSDIDVKHAEEVDAAIMSFAKTDEDFQEIENCMRQSLKLTSKMLDEVFEEFVKVKNGETSRYTFLEQLS